MKIIAINEEAFHALVQRVKELEANYDLLVEELVTDRLYTTKEVGEILGIGATTLQHRRDTGKLPHIKIRNTLRYRWKDIQKLFNKK